MNLGELLGEANMKVVNNSYNLFNYASNYIKNFNLSESKNNQSIIKDKLIEEYNRCYNKVMESVKSGKKDFDLSDKCRSIYFYLKENYGIDKIEDIPLTYENKLARHFSERSYSARDLGVILNNYLIRTKDRQRDSKFMMPDGTYASYYKGEDPYDSIVALDAEYNEYGKDTLSRDDYEKFLSELGIKRLSSSESKLNEADPPKLDTRRKQIKIPVSRVPELGNVNVANYRLDYAKNVINDSIHGFSNASWSNVVEKDPDYSNYTTASIKGQQVANLISEIDDAASQGKFSRYEETDDSNSKVYRYVLKGFDDAQIFYTDTPDEANDELTLVVRPLEVEQDAIIVI